MCRDCMYWTGVNVDVLDGGKYRTESPWRSLLITQVTRDRACGQGSDGGDGSTRPHEQHTVLGEWVGSPGRGLA